MRVYIIGNDGITLCRTAPAAVNNGAIAVASNEELRAAPLSAKRLLALWNALPGSRPSSWWRFGTGAEAPLKAAALVKGDRRSMRW